MAGLRALDSQPPPHAFNFLSKAFRFRDAGGATQYSIAFEMPIANLTATPAVTPRKHVMHASWLALVKDSQGQIVERLSRDIPSEVPDERLEAVKVEFMTYQRSVRLPPGHYTVETAVVDHEGNRASTSTIEIDSGESHGVGMSDVTLVRRLQTLATPPDPADPFEYTGKRILPFVTTDLFPGALPYLYFMLYPEAGNAATPELHVQLFKKGKAIATLQPPLPPPDVSGGIPMIVQPTDKPGSYEVKIRAVQGGSSTERSLTYTVAAR
jgi:hypothetical protein